MLVSGSDYLALPRAPETWLIEGLLPVGGSMLLYGDPKVGKSYAALQLACNIASGTEWLGFPIPQAMPVAYIQLDTPRSLWAKRVQDLAEAGHPVESLHYGDRDTFETYPFNILEPKHFAKLVRALKTVDEVSDTGESEPLEFGAVILDTLREAHSGDENDSTEMQEVIAHLDAAVKPAALILISHSRKANQDQSYSLMNDNRGSNYIVGRMDAICRFSHKSMRVTSRTLEEHSTDLERADDGTWDLREDSLREAARRLLQEGGLSTREMARSLHQSFPRRSESACRAVLRRASGSLGGSEVKSNRINELR